MPPPPKRLSKKEKKALLASKGGAEDDAGAGAGEDAGEVEAPALPDASSSSSAADGPEPSAAESESPASSTSTSAAATGAGAPLSGPPKVLIDPFSAIDRNDELGGDDLHRTQMAAAMEKVNVTTSTYQEKIHPNARDIRITNLSVILSGKVLFHETDLALSWGQRYGLIGPNGCGKSILMTLLGKRALPMPANIDVFHLVSEVEPSEKSALEAVLAVDVERANLERMAAEIEEAITGEDTEEQTQLNVRLCEVYERLEEMDAATAEARASQILIGLGFDAVTQHKKCKDFSGGWRMRVALARALFMGPDLLILDEPTNHLDMEAVVWLEKNLAGFKKILLITSHSQDFMNQVCTQIIRVHQKGLVTFGGNYDQYVETRKELEKAQMARFEWEQDQIGHMKDFIARFGHGTRKMAMQAQSREKVLKKMEEAGLTEKVEFEKALKMRFNDPGPIPPPVLMLANVSFGYPGGKTLYKNVDFGVDLDSRIALVGPNGAGKTTLLKLMCGDLIPTEGAIRPHPHLRIARYTQHFVDALDLSVTPLDYFVKLLADVPLAEVRSKLGRFGITGEFQTQVMAELSDGIKSRVVFALMATRSPHILMLDEPTNHLDIETIDSLADAINAFPGGCVVVTHDFRLIRQVAKQIVEVADGCVRVLPVSIQEYKQMLTNRMIAAAEKFERDRKAKAATGR